MGTMRRMTEPMAGTKSLRESFNRIGAPLFVCTLALMDTSRAHDVECNILTFVGTRESGEKFTISSRPVKQDEDPNLVAAETATKLIEEDKNP